jgi:hypothetical protein
LLDRTARRRGPAHRSDREHSLEELVLHLALRGQLTADNLVASGLQLQSDRLSYRLESIVPRGRRRSAAKFLFEDLLLRVLESRRRRSK